MPGKVISQEYILEYGRDCIEMHVGAVEPGERALVVDDLIATGGTLCAAMDLLGKFLCENSNINGKWLYLNMTLFYMKVIQSYVELLLKW